MVGEVIGFSNDELLRETASLRGLSQGIGGIVSGVSQQPNPTMYGLLMSPVLAPVMGVIAASAGRFLAATSGAFTKVSDQMADTQRSYAQVEADNAKLARDIILG